MNEQLTWKEIEQQYPNMWAFVQNLKRNNNGDIISFKLLTICSKQDKVKWLKKYTNEHIDFQCIRTTYNAPNAGGIFAVSGDKQNADVVLQICDGANAELDARLRSNKGMCEALREIMADDLKAAEDKGIALGIGRGIEQGTDIVNYLNRILIDAGRLDDLTKATLDPNYQKKLIKELVPVKKQ